MVSSVYEVHWRVLRERLEQMAVAAERTNNEDTMRLALCCLALLERHTVDDKGRCRWCRVRRGWSWLRFRQRLRRCTVVPLIGFYLEESRVVTITSS